MKRKIANTVLITFVFVLLSQSLFVQPCDAGRRAALLIGNDNYYALGRVQTEPHEQVFFYCNGHGVTVPDDDGDEGWDGAFDEALLGTDEPGEQTNLESAIVRDDKIYRFIQQIAATTELTLVMFDSCFSVGSIKSGTSEDLMKLPEKEVPYTKLMEIYRTNQAKQESSKAASSKSSESTASKDDQIRSSSSFEEMRPAVSKGKVVFFSASSEFEVSRAGLRGELSLFTTAFVSLADQGFKVVGVPLTMQDLSNKLAEVLRGAQTPSIQAPVQYNFQSLVPNVIADAEKTVMQRRGSQVVASLLQLERQLGRPKLRIVADVVLGNRS